MVDRGGNLVCEPRTGGTTQWQSILSLTHKRQPWASNSDFQFTVAQACSILPQIKHEFCKNNRKSQKLSKRFTGATDKRQSMRHFSLLTLELRLSLPLSCGHKQGVQSHKDLDWGASLPHRVEVCFLHREPSLGCPTGTSESPVTQDIPHIPKQHDQGSDI